MNLLKYPLFFALLIVCSCNDDECTDSTSAFSWTQNRSIDSRVDSIFLNDTTVVSTTEYFITDGESNLFNYTNIFETCRDIADIGGGSTLFIFVPVDSTESFSYTDEEIIETSAFLRLARGLFFANHTVEEGEMTGTKIDDDSWRISIDVVTKPQEYPEGSDPVRIVIDEIFRLE